MPRTLTDVERELNGFANADAIADHFRARGIRGLFGIGWAMRNCPIARYIQVETGNTYAKTSDINYTSVVYHFMLNYDHHKYPDLIDNLELS